MDTTWYYAEGERTVGPLSLADIRAILSRVSNAGRVFVWRNGFATWVEAESVPELAPYVIKPPPLPVFERIVPPAAVPWSPTLHPWRRFFARIFDSWLFALVFFSILGVIFPELFQTTQSQATTHGQDYAYSILGLGAYAVFETICLNTFGVTFGKFLYRIHIEIKELNQIPFSIALKRSLAVWFRGLALGIPLLNIITFTVAYRTLLKEGQTSWDHDFGCLISHQHISVPRWIIIAVAWLLLLSVWVILMVLGSS
jgi:uncharacterized RDD family membrane protein YckC